ncbi:hypothetical protein BpHYR1_005891 [Brachionus plicatilis]|uniref:Uncharacterized protein n=1 Tax=Brachionus plicatilis TaxID=10195 RepID=A0A3M7QM63_BRAPC|nr:hypothetical protein BpHYR1_005891 [Brachionus plicatilis]
MAGGGGRSVYSGGAMNSIVDEFISGRLDGSPYDLYDLPSSNSITYQTLVGNFDLGDGRRTVHETQDILLEALKEKSMCWNILTFLRESFYSEDDELLVENQDTVASNIVQTRIQSLAESVSPFSYLDCNLRSFLRASRLEFIELISEVPKEQCPD